ncbi:FMN-dependent NADH-azoreductase [Chelatococcus reniformis]|uniref:FMN dependent NADH:quinone oxidoreductase n=1 Tax=Chelatococcus reniformis TaxID=1494448 RepID=A0A916UII0_9HYPH|nr:NAD(P)H-dependent oxidoreductase [Chelatococcus reniformis]GGC74328.1 FMN-dependent NADH-azoreductase 2 [Chelatococcus reniformis]
MKLLHIDSSITGGNSVSRQLTAGIVGQLRQAEPGVVVTYRDLAEEPLEHLTLTRMPQADGANRVVLDEFLDADIVVVGAPMYNFTVPSQLKAWIDRILIAGETFRYGAQGVEGLAGGKRVIVALSRGGFYGAGTPAAALEHLETYLRGVFGFIGVTPELIIAEGLQAGPEHRESALAAASDAVSRLKAA